MPGSRWNRRPRRLSITLSARAIGGSRSTGSISRTPDGGPHMDKDKLVRRSSALSGGNKPSLAPREIMLRKELELTRQNAKAEVEEGILREFYREFGDIPEPALQWAFREHRRRT